MAVDAEESGMDAFMVKPFKLEELTAVYIKLLERNHRNQRDIPTRPTPVTHGVDTADTPTLGTASHMGGGKSSLEEEETSPSVAVVVSESEWNGKGETGQVQPPTGSGSGKGIISGIKHNNAKVHATN